jgi:hypothetical protein
MIGWFEFSGGCPVRIGPQRSFKPTDVACRRRAESLINGFQSVRIKNPLSNSLSQDVHERLRTGADFVLLGVRSPELYAKGPCAGGDQSSPRQNRSGQTRSMAGDHPVRDLLRRPALQWGSSRRSTPGQAGTASHDHGRRHNRLDR